MNVALPRSRGLAVVTGRFSRSWISRVGPNPMPVSL